MKQDQEVHLTRDNEDEAALLLSIVREEKAMVVSLSEQNVFLQQHESCDDQKDVWYLDNGASNHMTGQKEIFAELDGSVTGVRFGDGSKMEIKGKGTLLCECENGDQLLIPDVYYIPALPSSILSIGQMTEEGYDVSIKDDFLKLRDEQGRLLMKVKRSPNHLYKIKITSAKTVCLSSKLEEEAWIWHVRLGHVNIQLLESMARRGCVKGLPVLTHPRQVCEGCLLAKQTRGSFSKEAQWRAKEPLELLHADLCGPITPLSKGGNRYIFLIVDDFSRYMWVYLLKAKDEALSKFKIFKTEVEKETGFAIKMLRTDQGCEFNSDAFKLFYQETGIRRQRTTPYIPQHNGVVERRNKTVMGMVQALLQTMKVPYTFWGGSCAKPGSMGFKLYDPTKNKVVIARDEDVIFKEHKTWDWVQEVNNEKTTSTWAHVSLNSDVTGKLMRCLMDKRKRDQLPCAAV
ncbi:hypothetical protein E3N88_23766 [Mikania micrantha]|uniref:Integrase catalytic domain-containing protein n=1 Tax=Mikania micrantha TaxID=192012 RepID=A0A5N6NGQ5_9ASTR|nr:hypothetical protein E3N88_23766 [Mikania micrantha]